MIDCIQENQIDYPEPQSLLEQPLIQNRFKIYSPIAKCRGSRIKKKTYRIRRSTILSDHVVYLPESDVDIGHKDDPKLFSHAMSGENST